MILSMRSAIPLIKLKKASEETGCTILGKAEFLNPGGSVKDRAAKYIILDAEERGDLQPGGVIVEGTEIPALACRWSGMHADTAPLSLSPKRKAREKRYAPALRCRVD